MSDSFDILPPREPPQDGGPPSDFPPSGESKKKIKDIAGFSTAFANAMSKAFAQAIVGGKQFDDVLKNLALRMSALTLAAAFKPLAKGLAGGLTKLLGSIFGIDIGKGGGGEPADPGTVISNFGDIQPFASGGVIGSPSYFPVTSGGWGLAGEAGPEAIMPLRRGPDGTLGVTAAAGAPANITIQIVAPDPDSFRRSESYITGQIARAVARGQRSL